jgi:predicted Zn-dependent peptidase
MHVSRFSPAGWLTRASALAAVISVLALASPAAIAAQSTPQVRISYVQDSLPNGLHVIYSIDRSTPVVAAEVMYNVGSKSERPGKTGFAHLFEHMMFKGSRNVPDGQHFALLEKVGGRAGADINGTTSWDRTNYFEQVPSNQLDLALWLEADRMGTLVETLTQAKLDNQREVVKNERRQSFDNQPYGSWLEKALTYVYPENHPYHHSVIGSMTDLTNASVDDVKSFFKTYYAPNNAVLVIAGDIDLADAKALVRKRFSWIPRGPVVPPRPSLAIGPSIGAERREVVQDRNASAPAVYVAYRMPAARAAEGPTVDLLSDMLAGGSASALYKSLVRDKQAAVAVQGFNFGLIDGADMLVFVAVGKAATNPDSLEHALLAELDNAASLINQASLDRSRAGARFNFVNGLQSTGGFGGRADQLAEGFTYYRNPNHVNTVLSDYDTVTVARLRSLVASRLVPTNRVRLVFVPVPKPATSGGND